MAKRQFPSRYHWQKGRAAISSGAKKTVFFERLLAKRSSIFISKGQKWVKKTSVRGDVTKRDGGGFSLY